MLKAQSTALLTALALALAACGGDDKNAEDGTKTTAQTPTATPSPTGTPKAKSTPEPPTDDVEGINVFRVGQARDRFVAVCAQRQKDAEARKDGELMTDLRKATTTLIRAFRKNPDEKFRRTPGVPNLAMRARLVSLGFIARRQCGGGTAVAVGERITREIARLPEES